MDGVAEITNIYFDVDVIGTCKKVGESIEKQSIEKNA
jgi:hypothetical protein